jgi:peptidoglycan/LPS O-acetylase OafA/YrhL
MTFGLIGLLNRYLRHENSTIRYLSDSAYWLYIVHHPLVALFQSLLRPWDVPALLKWLILCVVLLSVLLVSYHFLVRSTWIGWILNGRRAPKAEKS